MTKNSRSKYMMGYAKEKYDKLHTTFQKGELDVIRKAAAAEGKSINSFLTDCARKEARNVLGEKLDEIRGYRLTASPMKCSAENIFLYIDTTRNTPDYPAEPLRMIAIDLDSGYPVFRRDFRTLFSNEDTLPILAPTEPSESDIAEIMGFMKCRRIYTFGSEGIGALEDAWYMDVPHSRVFDLERYSGGQSLRDAIGLTNDEKETGFLELTGKLLDYARSCPLEL